MWGWSSHILGHYTLTYKAPLPSSLQGIRKGKMETDLKKIKGFPQA